ncbi:biotin--[acetyl-CoA-carboxylase] ligase [Polaribacter sp.]|uniref:biotin--[acetyl-CoA-carboxylase] ligase n=1 Tax=Polaribacter sp. TaxID=1920175 RepID=UPI003F6A644F
MKIIKLNAIASTNSFLKEMAKDSALENFTVVQTENQLNGRGQQHAKWVSDPFKNLTFSVFVKFKDFNFLDKKYLNFAISLAIFEVLKEENIKNIAIKWPNDILSGKQKICGILIENNIKGTKINSSVIGIGLNVNQKLFSESLKNVSSLSNISGKIFDLDDLLKKIILQIELKIRKLEKQDFKSLETDYLNVLYKKNIPTMFKDSKDVLFMGIIRGISNDGKLKIELENESVAEFGIKEVAMV